MSVITKLKQKIPIKFLIALDAEASPIINFYNLKRDYKYSNFYKVYANSKEKIFLIISGIGSKKVKESINLIYYYHKVKECLWVNIGLGGHNNIKEGTFLEIKKVITQDNKNSLFTNIFYNNIKTNSLCSVKSEEKIYAEDYIYDMEGYHFLKALENISNRDNTFIFKIISDTLLFKPKSYKSFAIKNISIHLKSISAVLQKYRFIDKNNDVDIDYFLNLIREKYHLTFYNQNKLKKIVTKIFVIKNKNTLKEDIINSTSLSSLIKKYEYYLKNYSLKI